MMTEQEITTAFKTLVKGFGGVDQAQRVQILDDMLHRLSFERRLAELTPRQIAHMTGELSPGCRTALDEAEGTPKYDYLIETYARAQYSRQHAWSNYLNNGGDPPVHPETLNPEQVIQVQREALESAKEWIELEDPMWDGPDDPNHSVYRSIVAALEINTERRGRMVGFVDLGWEACEACQHWNAEHESCTFFFSEVEGALSVDTTSETVSCLRWKERDDRE